MQCLNCELFSPTSSTLKTHVNY